MGGVVEMNHNRLSVHHEVHLVVLDSSLFILVSTHSLDLEALPIHPRGRLSDHPNPLSYQRDTYCVVALSITLNGHQKKNAD